MLVKKYHLGIFHGTYLCIYHGNGGHVVLRHIKPELFLPMPFIKRANFALNQPLDNLYFLYKFFIVRI